MQRVDTDHGIYRIIAGRQAGTVQAIAYLGHRRVDAISADDVDAAVQGMRERLDRHLSERLLARRDGVPASEEFAEAFELLGKRLSEAQTAILLAFSRIPQKPWTIEDLAVFAKVDQTTAEREFSLLGRRVSLVLDYKPKEAPRSGAVRFIAVLATTTDDPPSDSSGWIVRPEVLDAIRETLKPDRTRRAL